MRILLGALILVFLLAGFLLYPQFHNRYVHPLGRLAGSISKGDDCDAVRVSALSYAEVNKSTELQLSQPVYTMDLLRIKVVDPMRGVSIYDVSFFDDIQLQVRCGPDGNVAEKLFIGD